MIPNRPTVVFADDNLRVIDTACALLSFEYRVVKVAVDGEEAVHSICELKPDFAILDISMPKINGIKVARQVRLAGLHTRVVFVTIIDDEDYFEEAQSISYGYVLKRRLKLDLLRALASAQDGLFYRSASESDPLLVSSR